MNLKRQLFICSAIEKCRETANCCSHKQPHIKDERCVPRECRYAPGVDNIDCDLWDPENPRVPVPQPIVTRTVEEVMRERAKTAEEPMKVQPEEVKEEGPAPSQQPVTIIKKTEAVAPAGKKGGRKKA